MLARLRIGTRSGHPSKATCGARPTSSASVTGAWRSTASSSRARGSASWSSTLHETCATSPRAERVSPIARRPGSPSAPLSRMARAMRRASSAVAVCAQLEVEGHQRRARGDEDRARGRMHPRGAEVGFEPVGDPLREAGRAAAAQLGARAPIGQHAVEEDGQAQLAEGVGERERLGRGGAALLGGAEDDGRDVEGADVRVQPRIAGDVDALDRHPGSVGERLVQGPRRGGQREDGAVVVGVGVAVEHARAAGGERCADGVEDRAVAALGDVGNGQQHAQST